MDISEGIAPALQIIKYTDQVVLASIAEDGELVVFKAYFIYMGQLVEGFYICLVYVQNVNCYDFALLNKLF